MRKSQTGMEYAGLGWEEHFAKMYFELLQLLLVMELLLLLLLTLELLLLLALKLLSADVLLPGEFLLVLLHPLLLLVRLAG